MKFRPTSVHPVVEAAEIWRTARGFGISTDALTAAVDAYRAARKTGG